MNASKFTALALIAILGCNFASVATAQVRQAPPAAQTPPKIGSDSEMMVIHPNGNGCPPTAVLAECFTEFKTLHAAKEACNAKVWHDRTVAFVNGRKQMCMHEQVTEVYK